VAINCAAIPETLVESELFGHEKGAFTGADRRRPGRFELAAGGTLLLDEIGDLPLAVQAKVLRVIEERRFERVGGGAPIVADARLVAATNRDLSGMVEAGDFRPDLLYRLEIFPIALPSLAERASDVPLLARHLLAAIAARLKVAPPELSPEAEAWLERQPFPGNIRQLANLLERAAIVAPGGRLRPTDFEPLARGAGSTGARVDRDGGDEARRLREALLEAGGDHRSAARALGISYRTLLRRLDEHDLRGFPKYRS
jgi:DNA-binding NtrC family response regulator